MSAPPWWDNVRTPIAFLVAPFVVPLIVAVFVPARGPQDTAAAIAVAVSAFVSYFGAFIFGVPGFLFLRAQQLTAFWIAPVAGFIAGTMMLFVFLLSWGSGSAIGARDSLIPTCCQSPSKPLARLALLLERSSG